MVTEAEDYLRDECNRLASERLRFEDCLTSIRDLIKANPCPSDPIVMLTMLAVMASEALKEFGR